MKVPFVDGSLSAMGVNPATFTTENFMVQHAIENSNDFKRGRIKVINVIELEEELRIESNNDTPAPSPAPESPAAPVAEAAENAPETPAESTAESDEADGNADTAPATQVEFSCNDDAKDYLEQTFGYVRSKLRNREDIVNAGKAHGVEIIFV